MAGGQHTAGCLGVGSQKVDADSRVPSSGAQSSASSSVPRPSGWNIRDVAEVDPDRIRQGRIYRSSQVFDQRAVAELKIRSAVDLRKSGRRVSRAAKRHEDPFTPAVLAENAGKVAGKAAEELRIRSRDEQSRTASVDHDTLQEAGLEVYHVELLPPRTKIVIFWRVPLRAKLKTLGAVFCCHSPETVMAPVVADPKVLGYAQLYKLMLDQSKPYIARALSVFSHDANLPTVIHCTHGKDRTGLVVALLGLILGCSEESIVQDYVISEKELRLGRSGAQEKGEIASCMVTDGVIASGAEVMQELVRYLRQQYGGIDGYVKAIGLSEAKVWDIRRNLLLPEVYQVYQALRPPPETASSATL